MSLKEILYQTMNNGTDNRGPGEGKTRTSASFFFNMINRPNSCLILVLAVVIVYMGYILFLGETGYGTPIPFWQQPIQVIFFHTIYQISPPLLKTIQLCLAWSVGLGFWFGFRRISLRNVLENQDRARIYSAICATPGIYFRELERTSDINRGTLTYHLELLERANKIVSLTNSGYTHYFQNNGKFSARERIILSEFFNPRKREILSLLMDSPSTMGAIKQHLGVSGPSVWWHLKILINREIIQIRETGNQVEYVLDEQVHRFLCSVTSAEKSIPGGSCNTKFPSTVSYRREGLSGYP
jgi:predicted transcriptional regulator